VAQVRFLVLLLLVSGCASTGSGNTSPLAGKWLGHSSVNFETRCWVNHRRPDGTYELTFLFDSSAAPRRIVEEGLWLHSHGVYATIAQKMNGQPIDLRNKFYREFYRIEVLDDQQFVYADIATGARFRVVRVPDSFVLGDRCPSGA
jgi:hypothetical protein